MRNETVDQEIGKRIRKLYYEREKDLPQLDGVKVDLVIGPVRISHTQPSWLVVMDYGPGKTIVYFDMDGIRSEGDNIPDFDHEPRNACLKYLRGLMVLEDLADA